MADLSTIDLTTRSENGAPISATLYDATLTSIQTAVNNLVNHVNPLGAYTLQVTGGARIGATAGWVVTASNLDYVTLATCPASKTAATLVVPIPMAVGTQITGYTVRGQIESGGNTVTLDAALKKVTITAADLVAAAVTSGAITQVSVTADSVVAASVTGLTETSAAGTTYFLLITATTGVSTDIALASVDVTLDETVTAT